MRRLIDGEEQVGSFNNALVTPPCRHVPGDYSSGFDNPREIDGPVKMQSAQEPSCLAGGFPGVDVEGNVPPPTLDHRTVPDTGYFTDLGEPTDHGMKCPRLYDNADRGGVGITDSTHSSRQDEGNFVDTLFNLENIASAGDLFNDSSQGSQDFRG